MDSCCIGRKFALVDLVLMWIVVNLRIFNLPMIAFFLFEIFNESLVDQ